MPNGCSYFTSHFFQCHQNTIILSQCSIVHIALSSHGLIPLTFTGDSYSNPGPHEKKTQKTVSCIYDTKTSMPENIIALTGKVAQCQS